MLPTDLVEELSRLHRSIYPMIENVRHLVKSLDKIHRHAETDDRRADISNRIKDTIERITSNVTNRYPELLIEK
jgi:hypothetical protein